MRTYYWTQVRKKVLGRIKRLYWFEKITLTSKVLHISYMDTLKEICHAKRREFAAYLALMGRKHRAPVRFLILATPRTGTNLLADLLNQHPLLYCDAQILLYRTAFPSLYVDGKSCCHAGCGYGFRVMVDELARDQQLREDYSRRFLEKLVARGWKLISLQRNDIFRQAVSVRLAFASGEWYCTSVPRASSQRFALNPEGLHHEIEWIRKLKMQQDNLLRGLPHLNVVYEADLLDPSSHQKTAEKIFAFLGLPSVPVAASVKQLHPHSVAEYVENYEEVEKVFFQALKEVGVLRDSC